jgi:hypothetical protein
MRLRLSRLANLSLLIGAATIALPMFSIGNASAATLTIVGGTDGALPSSFNPNGAFPAGETIASGTAIKIFDGSTSGGLEGLPVSPTGVNLIFTYIGYEAAYSNQAFDQLNYAGTPLFTNQSTGTAPGTSTTPLLFNLTGINASGGYIPFTFNSLHYASGSGEAINGGTIASGLEIAFATVSSTVAYAFFDDGGAGPDRDFDDMVVRIQISDLSHSLPEVPLPAALPLFASGLGALGLLGWRRKRKAAAKVA